MYSKQSERRKKKEEKEQEIKNQERTGKVVRGAKSTRNNVREIDKVQEIKKYKYEKKSQERKGKKARGIKSTRNKEIRKKREIKNQGRDDKRKKQV